MAVAEQDKFTLQEITTCSIIINKSIETSIEWNDNILSVQTENGLNLFEFTCNLLSFSKNIDFNQYNIESPKSSPAIDIFEGLDENMSLLTMNQMLTDPVLWPHSKQLMNEISSFISHAWSPSTFTFNDRRIVATLSNIGQIDFFGYSRLEWISLSDINTVIKEYYNVKIPCMTIEEMYHEAAKLETCAFCWGPKLSSKSFFYFVTAQHNSDIMFWSIELVDKVLKAKLLQVVQMDTCKIMSLFWEQISDDKFMIVYTTVLGEIFALDCSFNHDNIHANRTCYIWKYQDKIIVNNLLSMIIDDKILLIYSKHRQIVGQLFDRDYVELRCTIMNVNDNRITSLKKINTEYYICTANSCVYKIVPNVINGELSFNKEQIFTKEKHSSLELHDIANSYNGVLWVYAFINRKIACRKEPITIDLIYHVNVDSSLEVTKLFSNPAKSLTNMWDCIEIIRCKITKSKLLPSINREELHINQHSDVYKMKLIMFLYIMFQNLQEVIYGIDWSVLPEVNVENITDLIMLKHFIQLISRYLEKYPVHDFQDIDKEVCMGAKMYLNYYAKKYEQNLNDFISESELNTIDFPEFHPRCANCNEGLESMICINGHLNTLCLYTYTVIKSHNYIFCPVCNSTYNPDTGIEYLICILCDQRLCGLS